MARLSYRDPATGQWAQLGTIGPPGPAGPSAVSADANNAAILGTDTLIYVPNEVIVSTGAPTFINGMELWVDPAAAGVTVVGPTGPPGPNAVSTDADNLATLGTDSLIYVPDPAGEYVDATGGTMTGPLLLPAGDPPNDPAATRKKYVDDRERALTVNAAAAGGASWNDFTAPGPYGQLMHGTFNANGPGVADYFYLTNYVYSGTVDEDLSGAHTLNVTQVATAYHSAKSIFLRSRYGGTWTEWADLRGPSVMRTGELRIMTAPALVVAHATEKIITGFAASTGDKGNGIITYSNGNFTVSLAGYYDITGYVAWASGSVGYRRVEIRINEAVIVRNDTEATTAGTGFQPITLTGAYLAANDVVSFNIKHTQNADLNMSSARAHMRMVAVP